MKRFLCYEDFEKEDVEDGVNTDTLLLQYAILFRRWDKLKLDVLEEKLGVYAYIPEVDGNMSITWRKSDKYTIENLLNYNIGYYNKIYHGEYNKNVEIGYYSEIIENGKNLYDIFFCGQFPMLNVIRYECQMRASNKLKVIPYHLVFDEVGTGKTVTALYCIRDVLLEKGMDSKILVICPNNKIVEWQKDIQRQLGLYAHVVEYGNNQMVYKDGLKSIYFKNNEACIFIEGQKKGEINDSLNSWSKDVNWDIVVIDEGHLCFDNYNSLYFEKIVILTATPIVINSSSKEGILTIDKVRKINDYIKLASKFAPEYIQVDNLFSAQECITQLFREDLKISPKIRKIQFEYTERWKEREEYLEVLKDTVGGMTRLIYEQDDEFLLHGVYEKFRLQIEAKGYSLDKVSPSIENHKYEKVRDIIFRQENDGKSYIIFFNSKWPTENIYNMFINDNSINKEKTIFAIKFGKSVCKVWPKDANVKANNLFDYLLGKIDSEYRVVFLTTGATGGTGLNLGKFNGIINYEIPFTSIELEQRFGRVDRMDIDDGSREMYFILNNDSNPMLRYGVLKINATSLFMPIRNTILFCPEYVKANFDSLTKELETCKLLEEEKEKYQLVQEKRSALSEEEQKIVDSLISCIVKTKSIHNFEQDISAVSKECVTVLEHIQENQEFIISAISKKKNIHNLGKEVINWLELLGIGHKGKTYEIGSAILPEEDTEEYAIEELSSEEIKSGNLLIFNSEKDSCNENNDVDTLIELLNTARNNVNEQSGSGIFYYNDGYHRETVDEYRKKCVL